MKYIGKLNSRGSLHAILPAIVVVGVGIIGAYKLVASHADPILPSIATQHVSFAKKVLPLLNDEVVAKTRADSQKTAGDTTYCQLYNACYFYVAGSQIVSSATGASVTMTQGQPTVGVNDSHSLAELAVSSADRNSIVEVGWTVDPGVNGDALPHLFVYHWANHTPTCYNGCGFVPLSTMTAGSPVTPGETAAFKIQYIAKKWFIYYNNTKIGYFPESLWSSGFNSIASIQPFGEVAAAVSEAEHPMSQMGNGIAGSAARSTKFSNFRIIGSTDTPALSVYSTSTVPNTTIPYSAGAVTSTGFRFGGPGN